MKCDEAGEYVSALYDGATVPPPAAAHIDACEDCRARLKEYIEMGAELRRMASLEISGAPVPHFQPGPRRIYAILWQKGRKTMRIPRIAFASLLVAIVLLGSGWVRQSVRADSQGSVLLVQYTMGSAPASFCALSAIDKKFDSCAGMQTLQSGKVLLWEIEVLSKDGDRATLGVRAAVEPPDPSVNSNQIRNLAQQQYSFRAGDTLNVNVDELGAMSVTGQWIDHIPAISIGEPGKSYDLDPGPGELRFYSPLLLHGDQVAGDLEGASTSLDKVGQAVDIYLKGIGRFDLSLSPMPGAVEGKVRFNRITATIGGQTYVFVTGAPITRSQIVWVLLNPRPPIQGLTGGSYLGSGEIGKLLSGAAQN